jgi:hypothetical protein
VGLWHRRMLARQVSWAGAFGECNAVQWIRMEVEGERHANCLVDIPEWLFEIVCVFGKDGDILLALKIT